MRPLSHRCLKGLLLPSHGLKTVNGMLFLSKKTTSFSDRNVTVCYEILRSDGLSGKEADRIIQCGVFGCLSADIAAVDAKTHYKQNNSQDRS